MVLGILIIFELHKFLLQFLKLKVEAIKLFDSIIRDLHVTINQSVKLLSLIDYIHKWRVMGIGVLHRV
jgi:hypothetical protein